MTVGYNLDILPALERQSSEPALFLYNDAPIEGSTTTEHTITVAMLINSESGVRT